MNLDERIEMLRVNIESLHSNIAQLFEITQATDQRIDKLTGHMANLNVTMGRLANIA